MIDTDKYEGHDMHRIIIDKSGANHSYVIYTNKHGGKDSMYVNDTTAKLIADAPLLLAEVKRLQSEPTVTVDDYHKKGHLYVTVRFPDGEEYVGLVEKWEGE